MVLHFIINNTKINYPFLKEITNAKDKEEHKIILCAGDTQVLLNAPMLLAFKNVVHMDFNSNKTVKNRKEEILGYLKDAKNIYWHGLLCMPTALISLILKEKNVLKKSVWIVFDEDFKIANALKIKAAKDKKFKKANNQLIVLRHNIQHIICSSAAQSQQLKIQFNIVPSKKKDITEMFYPPNYDTSLYLKTVYDSLNVSTEKKPLVMLNHKITDNGFVAMDLISGFFDNIDLNIPVNFGMYYLPKYKTGIPELLMRMKMMQYGIDDNCILNAKISNNQYIDYVSTVDIAVFNFSEWMAYNLIVMLGFFRKKVFLSEKSSLYKYLLSVGFPVFRTEDIPTMDYYDFIKPAEYNKKVYFWIEQQLISEKNALIWNAYYNNLIRKTK